MNDITTAIRAGRRQEKDGQEQPHKDKRTLGEKFADMANAVMVKTGRGVLDAVGLEGVDVRGFEGAPQLGKEGPGVRREEFVGAVARTSDRGLDPVLGDGFERRAAERAMSGLERPAGGRDRHDGERER